MPARGLSACLSGWGQAHDALSVIAPDATHIDYARHTSVPDALQLIAQQAAHHDTVIGWSLGGQMAVRAIAAGLIKPKQLVLIATPFQFVANAALKLGMPAILFEKFHHNYRVNPKKTLHKAWELIPLGDSNAAQVSPYLARQDKDAMLTYDWLQWLTLLQDYSCLDLNVGDFPPTLLIHGDKDHVVYPEQSGYFARAIPHARHIAFTGCGHAPHWHDPAQTLAAIRDHIHA